MKIGITDKSYPTERNILNKVSGAEYLVLRKNNNLFHSLSTLKNLIFRKKIDFKGQYFFYQKPKIDVLHLFNDINYSSQKWLSTCETLVPRFNETKDDHQKVEPSHTKNKKTEKALKKIAKKNCLGIICISDAGANIQFELLKNYPKLENTIKNKISVLHPPQKLIDRNSEEFYKNLETFHFIFVGSQFFRKGGVEMIEVLQKLKEKYKFKLTLISTFETDNYVTKISKEEASKYVETLKNETWLEIFEKLPNEKVLELIKKSHVGLLPTWSDTYGFSVLEMQAAGVPVISTDIRALPEINNEDCGWLINLPQNRLKQALYFTEEQKEILKNTLKEQLETVLINIFEHPEQLIRKSKNSVKRIQEMHEPKIFEENLKEIYNKS